MKNAIGYWACIMIANMNLLESKCNILFVIFWLCLAAWYAYRDREDIKTKEGDNV